jgi:hypothetical protein
MFTKKEPEEESFELKEEISNKKKSEVSEKKLEKMSLQLHQSSIKIELERKIKEIDDLYQKGVIEYTESIYRYNIEIEKIRNEITITQAKNKKAEMALLDIEKSIEYQEQSLVALHQKFMQKTNSIVELKSEYKDALQVDLYQATLKRKKREVYELIDEIEEMELSFLNKELQRINLEELLEPKRMLLEELNRNLTELELEKSYFESTGLQRISRSNIEQQALEHLDKKHFVDTEIMEDS